MTGRLASKVAIVTGAAQGIGRAIAEGFVREGARVVVADLLAEQASAVCHELNHAHRSQGGAGDVAFAVTTDVADPASVNGLVKRVGDKYGRIDVLINNAAIWKSLERRAFWAIPVEEWDRVFVVNTRGPFLCSAAVAPVMKAQNCGRIIFIGSATVWTAQSTLTHYASSKAALIGLMRCIARELGPHNICVNMVHPGMTDSGGQSREYLEARAKLRLIQRVQMPADVVGATVFLASDESAFVTGQQLHVDGGTVLT